MKHRIDLRFKYARGDRLIINLSEYGDTPELYKVTVLSNKSNTLSVMFDDNDEGEITDFSDIVGYATKSKYKRPFRIASLRKHIQPTNMRYSLYELEGRTAIYTKHFNALYNVLYALNFKVISLGPQAVSVDVREDIKTVSKIMSICFIKEESRYIGTEWEDLAGGRLSNNKIIGEQGNGLLTVQSTIDNEIYSSYAIKEDILENTIKESKKVVSAYKRDNEYKLNSKAVILDYGNKIDLNRKSYFIFVIYKDGMPKQVSWSQYHKANLPDSTNNASKLTFIRRLVSTIKDMQSTIDINMWLRNNVNLSLEDKIIYILSKGAVIPKRGLPYN